MNHDQQSSRFLRPGVGPHRLQQPPVGGVEPTGRFGERRAQCSPSMTTIQSSDTQSLYAFCRGDRSGGRDTQHAVRSDAQSQDVMMIEQRLQGGFECCDIKTGRYLQQR